LFVRAIQSEDVLVKGGAVSAESVFYKVLHSRRKHAGREYREVLIISAIERHLCNCSVLYYLAKIRGFRFQQRHFAGNLNDFRDLPEGHLNVHPRAGPRVEDHIRAADSLKSAPADFDIVYSDWKSSNDVHAGIGAKHLMIEPRRLAHRADACANDSRSGRIRYRPGDGCGIDLSKAGTGKSDKKAGARGEEPGLLHRPPSWAGFQPRIVMHSDTSWVSSVR
jgi:hypothetical protein